jgi:hypothetical protein
MDARKHRLSTKKLVLVVQSSHTTVPYGDSNPCSSAARLWGGHDKVSCKSRSLPVVTEESNGPCAPSLCHGLVLGYAATLGGAATHQGGWVWVLPICLWF